MNVLCSSFKLTNLLDIRPIIIKRISYMTKYVFHRWTFTRILSLLVVEWFESKTDSNNCYCSIWPLTFFGRQVKVLVPKEEVPTSP